MDFSGCFLLLKLQEINEVFLDKHYMLCSMLILIQYIVWIGGQDAREAS